MDLFTYLMAKKGHNTHRDLFSYLLGKKSQLPSEYQRLEYIESTGTQYIDSGVNADDINYSFNIDFYGYETQPTAFPRVFGYQDQGGVFLGTRFWYGNDTDINNTDVLEIFNDGRHSVFANKNYAIVDNIKYTLNTPPTSLAKFNFNKIIIFGSLNGNTGLPKDECFGKIKLYNFKIYHNNKLIRNFIPCLRKIDNEVGLYDIVGEQFYTNAGTGKFAYKGYIYANYSGTSLNISNTLQAKIKNIALEGNTSQDGTPTPDTPVPIKVVTGEQNIKIHNKNFFDKDNQVKVQVNAGGTLRYGIIVDAPNKKVSISAKSWNNSIAVKQLINGTYGDFLNINSNTIFNVTDKLIIYSVSDTAKLDSNIEDLQVEISNAPTSYVPYQSQTYPLSLGNIELAKIGNYKDYIFKNVVGSKYYNADLDLNEWYLHKVIEKITLSNSDSFTLDSYSLRFTKVLDTIYKQGGYSNRYIYGGTYQATGKFEILSNSRLAFNYPDSNIDTVTELQTYLTTNELYMYLPLSTPTNTKITDTTLISQLENINNNAHSYKDTTIIECSSASTDNETIGFSGEIKVTSVGNSLNTSLLSSNIQEETNIDDIQEEPNLDEIEEQNDEPIENEVS